MHAEKDWQNMVRNWCPSVFQLVAYMVYLCIIKLMHSSNSSIVKENPFILLVLNIAPLPTTEINSFFLKAKADLATLAIAV